MRPEATAVPPAHRITSVPSPVTSPMSGVKCACVRASRVGAGELGGGARLHRVGAHDAHAGQPLLHDRGQLAQAILHRVRARRHQRVVAADEQHQHGRGRHRPHGEPGIHRHHGGQRAHEGEDRGGRRDHAEADERAHRAHVAGGARHEIAGGIARERRRRKRLQRRVEAREQVGGHVLGGAGNREARGEPGGAVAHGAEDDQAYVMRQRRRRAVGRQRVDRVLDGPRDQQRQAGGDRQAHDAPRVPAAVRRGSTPELAGGRTQRTASIAAAARRGAA